MKVSRNSPCPCGSGKKYKKCCMGQDEKAAAEARREAEESEQQRQLAEAAEHDRFIKYATELEELSNQANDLIRSSRWDEAEACCRQLQQQFPEEIDGDHRFYEYYKARDDLANAKTHAQATLEKVESREGFDPQFPARLKRDIARFEDAILAERSNA